MPQFVTTLTRAAPRLVNKRDGTSFTLLEIFDAQNTPWVVRDDVYNVAMGMLGQQVEIVGRVEQKGNFTNRFADMIQLAGATPMQQVNPAVQAQAAAAQVGRAPTPDVFPSEKDRSIHRQVAAKVAAVISGDDPSAFWSNTRDLARYFDTGATPQTPPMQGVAAGEGYYTGLDESNPLNDL